MSNRTDDIHYIEIGPLSLQSFAELRDYLRSKLEQSQETNYLLPPDPCDTSTST